MRGNILLVTLIAPLPFSLAAPSVRLGGTTFIGRENLVNGLPLQEFFGGIPFASAPTDELRFAPPVLRRTLGVPTFDASSYSLPCPQIGIALNSSEDCLSLNILRPAGTHGGSALPVYTWIFGGGFEVGQPSKFNASGIVYASMLRGTPIIYVSINYRVGPFGFPQGAEAAAKGALNLGMKDQLAGLEWIHENIAAFGGDPHKVTVGGGSAGAMSISNLFLNSNLHKYVRGAIFESGTANTLPLLPSTQRELEWQRFVAAVPECAGAASNNTFGCLRNASIGALIQAYTDVIDEATELFSFTPVLDGPDGLIPDLPSKLFAAGKFARIPFISGTNLDDATLFVPTGTATDQDVVDFLTLYADPLDSATPLPELQSALQTLLEMYPNNPALGSPFGTGNETFGFGSQYKRVAAMAVDIWFAGPRRAFAHAASASGVDTFCYLFTDPQAVTPGYGVAHGNQIPYTFGETFLAGSPQPAANLSETMLDYWISFVASLDPNDGRGSTRPHWEKYSPGDPSVMQLQGGNVSVIPDTFRAMPISFINTHPIPFNH